MRSHLVALVALLAGCPRAQVSAPPPHVAAAAQLAPAAPSAPPVRLPRTFLPASYDARLELDPARDGFAGAIAITGTLAAPASTILLHGKGLTITSARATGAGGEVALAAAQRGDDVLELRAAAPLAAGTWTVAIDYTAPYEQVSTTGAFKQTVAGASYVYSQLEAVYARRVFPCLDEPDNKVPWKLTLDVPAQLVAVSNTPIASETPLPGGKKRVAFAQTKPLPSYLIAFGVGPFEIVDGGRTKRGTPVRVIALAKRGAEAAYAAQTGARIVELAEDWFGTPYPFEKLDLLTIPLTVGFGAMENAGLISVTESVILLDKNASKQRQRRWITLAAHEIAHQWFGDLVTMQFWDDIWLNEGFADWLEGKLVDKFEPAWQSPLAELATRDEALAADSLVSARRIRQPIATADDILDAFDAITYKKGASVLAMFEAYVGPAKFQQGVRDYLAARAGGNATSADFAAAVSKAAGRDLDAAFSSFLDHPGAPEITATLACDKRSASVELRQQRYVPPGSPPAAGGPWIVPVCVVYERAGKRAEACTLLDHATGTLALDTKTCPRWVMPNAGGRGYYRDAYTTRELVALRDEAWPLLSSVERRAIHFDVRAGVAAGRVPLALALSFVPRLLLVDDRYSVSAALATPLGLDAWVPDAQRTRYESWLRTAFGPATAAVGFTVKPSDSFDTETGRRALLEAVGWVARDPALVAEAVRLAASWRDVPQSLRSLVLQLAVDGDAATFDKVLAEARVEPDRVLRRELYGALAAVRDPARHRRVLALVLDPALDVRETMHILFGASTPATVAAVQAFFRAHQAELIDRLPKDATKDGVGALSALFTRTCRADQRDEVAAYVTRELAHYPGAKRLVDQAIEAMDQCIATRARLEPALRAWLSGIKLPKGWNRS